MWIFSLSKVNALRTKRMTQWEKGEFSKTVVIYCIRWMTAVLVWAIILTTIAVFVDKTVYLTEVLTFAAAFFGGELCLLALKRILAKERDITETTEPVEMEGDLENDQFDTDY